MTIFDSSVPPVIKGMNPAGSTDTAAGEPSSECADVTGWDKLKRNGFILLNLWLVFHLFAIVVCPASVEPSSRLCQSGFQLVAPYLHALFLDHGFHYFAPDPGASTLVSYDLQFADGSTKTGKFPDPAMFPRLRYHRSFMLSEFLGNDGRDELLPLIERSFARCLCKQNGAIGVKLTQIIHDTPSIDDVLLGAKLDDQRFYTESVLGTFTVEELSVPYVPKTDAEKPDEKTMADSNPGERELP